VKRAGAVRVRAWAPNAWPELCVAFVGLLICTGLPEALSTPGFRLLKHMFYAGVIGLLLLRWRASLQVAARDWCLCLLVVLLLASALWSDEPAWAFKRAAVMAQTTAFGLYLASRFSVGEQLRLFSVVVALALLVFVASALFDPVEAFATPGYESAFRGPLPHKNQVARLMALGIAALLLLWGGSAARRGWIALVLVGAVGFLVLSKSLGGVLAAAVLCSMIVAYRFVPSGWALALPPLAVVVGSLAATSGLLDGLLLALGKDPTLSSRTEIWSQSMRLLSERPLLGLSIASFWQREIVESTGMWFPNAHNGYLQFAIELGLVGLGLFALQLSTTLIRSLAWVRQRDRAALWPCCVAAFVLVYNFWEVATVEESSILWVLYVSASFTVRAPVVRRTPRLAVRPGRAYASRGVHA
jgi:exopolysaccharide production protein ExoQ